MKRLAAFYLCAAMSGLLWAQATSGDQSQSGSPAQTPAGQAADSATKAHDDSFVIGNDDVLSINVWKEPDISRSSSRYARMARFRCPWLEKCRRLAELR